MMNETKRFFEAPELDVIKFNETDVIVTSSGLFGFLKGLVEGGKYEEAGDAGMGDAPGRNDTPYFEDEF